MRFDQILEYMNYEMCFCYSEALGYSEPKGYMD